MLPMISEYCPIPVPINDKMEAIIAMSISTTTTFTIPISLMSFITSPKFKASPKLSVFANLHWATNRSIANTETLEKAFNGYIFR